MRAEVIRQLVEQGPSDLWMSILPPPKQHSQFDLVAIVQELRGPAALRL
jgi:hypothetical protein